MQSPPALKLALPKRRIAGADAALAALVISVVGLMVVPLPTWLLDLLLASNLAISVAILLVSPSRSPGCQACAKRAAKVRQSKFILSTGRICGCTAFLSSTSGLDSGGPPGTTTMSPRSRASCPRKASR